jgi:hypothetical protein
MTSDMMAEVPAGVGVIVVQIPSNDRSDQGSSAKPSSASTLQAPVSTRMDKLIRDTNAVFRFVFIVFLLSYFL